MNKRVYAWDGARVRKARAEIEARGWPQLCTKCHKPIYSTDKWHADHWLISRHTAKIQGIPLDSLPVAPAHASCNMKDGARISAALSKAKHNYERVNENRPATLRRGSPASRNIRGVA